LTKNYLTKINVGNINGFNLPEHKPPSQPSPRGEGVMELVPLALLHRSGYAKARGEIEKGVNGKN